MSAYLLLLAAIASRIIPHAGWMNFSLEGGALIYFGARRPWREMLVPLAIFMATDYYLTVFAYHYAFHWTGYAATWIWYLMAMALGQILLSAGTTVARVVAGALLGPTSFFVVVDYAVWAGGTMYPHTLAGLQACYVAAIPFYRNDLASTSIVLALAFGVPVLLKRMTDAFAVEAVAGK
jgi:hypothetical protein